MISRHCASPSLVQTAAVWTDVKRPASVYSSCSSALSSVRDGTSPAAGDGGEPVTLADTHCFQQQCLRVSMHQTQQSLACLVYWGAERHWALPLHCAGPALIPLPKTDVQKTAIINLEHTEPRQSDNEFDFPSRLKLTPCKISLQSTVELLCRDTATGAVKSCFKSAECNNLG